ncbi:hypothetical protein MP638_004544 [Amoeboaphelidium occidentale]|nr:hypothetical protein MP638_004544 [Amoeboaphelidium occidentale]
MIAKFMILRRYSSKSLPSWLPLQMDLKIALLKRSDFSSAEVQGNISDRLLTYGQRLSEYTVRQKSMPQYQRKAAILIPLCTVSSDDDSIVNEPSILFTLRSVQLRKHSGEVSFPGGLSDPVEDLCEDRKEVLLSRTAIRETTEELPSLDRKNIKILGTLPPIPDKTQTILVEPYVAYVGHVRAIIKDGVRSYPEISWNESEVSDVFTMSLTELLDESRVGLQSFHSRFTKIPYWRGPPQRIDESEANNPINSVADKNGVKCYRIWGLTAYVLNQFMQNILLK